MLTEKNRRWFKKNKEFLEKIEKKTDYDKEVIDKIVNVYLEQPEEIRRDVRQLMIRAIEEGEHGNWQEYVVASFNLLGYETRISKKTNNCKKKEKIEREQENKT